MSYGSIFTFQQRRKKTRHELEMRQQHHSLVWQGWENEESPITHLYIDDCVKSIGVGRFENLWRMRHCRLNNGLEEIKCGAFAGCSNLQEILIPDSVRYIGRESFFDCHNLIRLHLGEGVLTISASAFKDCVSLQSVVIPSSVVSIGREAFRDCNALTSIVFNKGLTRIDSTVFDGCLNLRKIEFGEDIDSLIQHLSLSEWWNNGIPNKHYPDAGVNIVRELRVNLPSIVGSKVRKYKSEIFILLKTFITSFGQNDKMIEEKMMQYMVI